VSIIRCIVLILCCLPFSAAANSQVVNRDSLLHVRTEAVLRHIPPSPTVSDSLRKVVRQAIGETSGRYSEEGDDAGRLLWLQRLQTSIKSAELKWEVEREYFLVDTVIPTRERFEALVNQQEKFTDCSRFDHLNVLYTAGFNRYADNLEIFFVSRIKALQQKALDEGCIDGYVQMLVLEARRFSLLAAHSKTDETLKRIDAFVSERTISPQLQLDILHVRSQHLLGIRAFADAAGVYDQMVVVHRLLNDTAGWVGSINNKGVCLYRMAESSESSYDAAEPVFLSALELAQSANLIRWVGIIKGNLGVLYKSLDRCTEAIKYFEIDYALTCRTSDYGSGVNALLSMAGCLVRLGQYDEAEERIRLAKELLGGREPGKQIRLKARAKLAEAEAQLFEARGDYGSALLAYQEFKAFSDSLDERRNEASLREIRMAYDVDRIENEKLLLEEQNRFNAEIIAKQETINRWSIIAIVLLVVVMAILLLAVRSSRKSRKHIQRLFQTTRRQNTKLSSFTYIVSHDLRSHATNMTSLLKILVKDRPELLDETAYAMLERSASNMARTIDDLHELLSAEDLHKAGNLQSIALIDVVTRVADNLQLTAKENNVQLRIDVPAQLSLHTIAPYIESVVHNLLSNGIKYSAHDRDAYVDLRAETHDGNAVITVSDNGLGIDLVDKARTLFQPYRTFHRHRDARGLGLFITRNQVEALGGNISVESTPGEGSTFTVILPLNPDYIFATDEKA